MIAACRDAGVPFKCTAGLHHAVRRGEEHGFLNILAATTAPNAAARVRARRGGPERARPRRAGPLAVHELRELQLAGACRRPRRRWGCSRDARVRSAVAAGACARGWTARVVDLSGLDPIFDAPSLNPFMAAGPEVWRQARDRVNDGNEVGELRRRRRASACRSRSPTTWTSTRRSTTRRTSAGCSGRTPSRSCRTGGTCRSATTGAPGRWCRAARRSGGRAGSGPGRSSARVARLDIELEAGFVIGIAEHDGGAGADRAGARPRVRHGAA